MADETPKTYTEAQVQELIQTRTSELRDSRNALTAELNELRPTASAWEQKAGAFQAELEIGALLPCNVIVYEDDSGKAVVSFMDPLMALGFIGNESLSGVAQEANDRLRRVLDKI